MTLPSIAIAWDAGGDVIAVLETLVVHDEEGQLLGVVDIAELERSGGEMIEAWRVEGAAGSGSWPEWIGGRALEFRVELEPGWTHAAVDPERPHRVRALVHKGSGHRRERGAIEGAAAQVKPDRRADLRRITGGTDRPLRLDDRGRTVRAGELPPRRLPVLL